MSVWYQGDMTKPALNVPVPAWRDDEETRMFADSVRRFLETNATPAKQEQWRHEHCIERAFWNRAGEAGLLGIATSAEYGGVGGSFLHEYVLMDELSRHGLDACGIPLHNVIVMPYIESYGTEEQKKRWLPRLASGELIGAIAMTEPGTGSDLQGIATTATRNDAGYVVNGSKTFITNGQTANFVVVVAKTDPKGGARGTSLLCVETDGAKGYERGRNLDKLGLEAADTSELFFNDVQVPADSLLGGVEGRGFVQLMEKLPQERLLIAVQSMAMIERALAETITYVKERRAFGKALVENQTIQFKLAELKTNATVARVFVDHCVGLHLEGKLDTATASMAKYWVSDLQNDLVDDCLQLFGGYGFMNEYPIARMFKDARVSRIYGGTNEIMKMLIARTL